MTKLLSAAAVATFALLTIAPQAHAQTPSECYARYPGEKGKRCCDTSYSQAPRGAMDNKKRVAQLNACVKRR